FDVWLMFWFGLGAFLLRVLEYPLAPAVLAIVLGGITEEKLRQSLLWSDGSPYIFVDFVDHPIAAPITIIAIILILMPAFQMLKKRKSPG
ncbi:MAG: tripartite tricarboxylate transporter permease, partial [Pseudomonadota bacterium]